jgi:hypothetical protein
MGNDSDEGLIARPGQALYDLWRVSRLCPLLLEKSLIHPLQGEPIGVRHGKLRVSTGRREYSRIRHAGKFIRRIWKFVKIVIVSAGQSESAQYYKQSPF